APNYTRRCRRRAPARSGLRRREPWPTDSAACPRADSTTRSSNAPSWLNDYGLRRCWPTRHALLTNEQLWLPFCSFTIHTLVHSFSGRFDLHREGRDMPTRARFALRVNDLASSLTFYIDRLGFQLVESQPDADLAVVLDPYGDPFVLAGPALEDL